MDKNSEIIAKIESLFGELKRSLGNDSLSMRRGFSAKNIKDTGKQKFSGLTLEIFNLVQEGYFDEPRKISEIVKKLHQRAINKPATSLMKPLRLLIWKKIINRNKPNGKGVYEYLKVKLNKI